MLLHTFIQNFHHRKQNKILIQKYYTQILLASRNLFFFDTVQIEDVTQKRLELLILHMCLATIQVRQLPHGNDIAQDLFDLFLMDMDINLREMGVGDLAVPKKMKEIGKLFYANLKHCDDTLFTMHDTHFEEHFCQQLAPQEHANLTQYLTECKQIIMQNATTDINNFPRFPQR